MERGVNVAVAFLFTAKEPLHLSDFLNNTGLLAAGQLIIGGYKRGALFKEYHAGLVERAGRRYARPGLKRIDNRLVLAQDRPCGIKSPAKFGFWVGRIKMEAALSDGLGAKCARGFHN